MEKVGDSFVSFCLRSRNLLLFLRNVFKKRLFSVRIYICSFVYIFFLFFSYSRTSFCSRRNVSNVKVQCNMIIFINTVSIKIVLLFEIKEVYLFIPRESFQRISIFYLHTSFFRYFCNILRIRRCDSVLNDTRLIV